MEIDHVFASRALVGRATTHEWGRPSLRAQRCAWSDGRPHSCVVVRPTKAPDAKTWAIPSIILIVSILPSPQVKLELRRTYVLAIHIKLCNVKIYACSNLIWNIWVKDLGYILFLWVINTYYSHIIDVIFKSNWLKKTLNSVLWYIRVTLTKMATF